MSDIVTRSINAYNAFCTDLEEQFGFAREEAEKILDLYRQEKIVRLDPVGGRYILSHGAFWEKDVLERAARL